jgi:hypothetical protein
MKDRVRAATGEGNRQLQAARDVRNASPGARYGTREPMTCDSLRGAIRGTPNGAQVKQLVQCSAEGEKAGPHLYLVDNLQVQAGPPQKANPYRMLDVALDSPYVPITGSYVQYQCDVLRTGAVYPNVGKNCTTYTFTHASGGCARGKSGDWQCSMSSQNPSTLYEQAPPPRN